MDSTVVNEAMTTALSNGHITVTYVNVEGILGVICASVIAVFGIVVWYKGVMNDE